MEMGFWDKAFEVAKNAGTAVYNELEKSANETREIRQKYEDLSDEELLKIVHSDGFFGKSSKEKAIAFGTLKNRGYDVEDIKARKNWSWCDWLIKKPVIWLAFLFP